MDGTPLLELPNAEKPAVYKAYPRRWYILFLLSMASMQQSCTWMTFSPISKEVKELYGFSSSTIDLLAAWGPIVYLPVVLVSPRMADFLGIRACITVAAACTCACNVLRAITTTAPYAEILAHAAQMLNAFSGPFVLATPSKLSSDWFPPHQRTFATSIGVMLNYTGTGVGFLLALPVSSPHHVKPLLCAHVLPTAVLLCHPHQALCAIDHTFFAAMPPTPPSASAAEPRQEMNLMSDLGKLFCNPHFMLLAATYGLSLGTYSGWSGVLDPILAPLHYSQDTASWLGFASTVGAVVGGLVLGHLIGVRRMKLVFLGTFLLSFGLFGWFSLLANRVVGSSEAMLFVSCTAASLVINAASGLFYEASVEASYPVNEVASVAIMTFSFNAASSVYMVANSKIPAAWMNWILTALCGLCFVALLFYKEERRRVEVDEAGDAAAIVPKHV